jgi:hypothetical protein
VRPLDLLDGVVEDDDVADADHLLPVDGQLALDLLVLLDRGGDREVVAVRPLQQVLIRDRGPSRSGTPRG